VSNKGQQVGELGELPPAFAPSKEDRKALDAYLEKKGLKTSFKTYNFGKGKKGAKNGQ